MRAIVEMKRVVERRRELRSTGSRNGERIVANSDRAVTSRETAKQSQRGKKEARKRAEKKGQRERRMQITRV